MKSFDARHSNQPSTGEPLMVLATTFAEATTPSKHIIQENTLRNLAALQPSIRAVIFSDSPKLPITARSTESTSSRRCRNAVSPLQF